MHDNASGAFLTDPVQPVALADSVLRLIWAEGRISRAEIARTLGLSRSTVTEIVKDLLETPFVREEGHGESSGGRRPIVLEFQYSARVILGCDIGATHVSIMLSDMQGECLDWIERPFPVRDDPAGTVDLVIELCDRILNARPGGRAVLLSVGVSLPSPVSHSDPGQVSDVIIPSWKDYPGIERLQAHFKVPVHVDNDANLGALAEYWWGAGRGVQDFLFLKYSYGIGAGYVLGGTVYRGHRGFAGEFGHMPFNPQGARCVCGLTGCLVTEIGGKALEDKARQMLADYPNSLLHDRAISLGAIEDAGVLEDPLALALLGEAFDKFGMALAGWINLMNPQMIVLGGSLTRIGDLLVTRIKNVLDRCSLIDADPVVDVRMSRLGSRVIALGAATLALERSLSQLLLHPPPVAEN